MDLAHFNGVEVMHLLKIPETRLRDLCGPYSAISAVKVGFLQRLTMR